MGHSRGLRRVSAAARRCAARPAATRRRSSANAPLVLQSPHQQEWLHIDHSSRPWRISEWLTCPVGGAGRRRRGGGAPTRPCRGPRRLRRQTAVGSRPYQPGSVLSWCQTAVASRPCRAATPPLILAKVCPAHAPAHPRDLPPRLLIIPVSKPDGNCCKLHCCSPRFARLSCRPLAPDVVLSDIL